MTEQPKDTKKVHGFVGITYKNVNDWLLTGAIRLTDSYIRKSPLQQQ